MEALVGVLVGAAITVGFEWWFGPKIQRRVRTEARREGLGERLLDLLETTMGDYALRIAQGVRMYEATTATWGVIDGQMVRDSPELVSELQQWRNDARAQVESSLREWKVNGVSESRFLARRLGLPEAQVEAHATFVEKLPGSSAYYVRDPVKTVELLEEEADLRSMVESQVKALLGYGS